MNHRSEMKIPHENTEIRVQSITKRAEVICDASKQHPGGKREAKKHCEEDNTKMTSVISNAMRMLFIVLNAYYKLRLMK